MTVALAPAPVDDVYYLCNGTVWHLHKHDRDCDGVCVMPRGHDGKCKCTVEYP